MIFNLNEPSLWAAAASIALLPAAWNAVARHEHRTRTLTRLFGGSAHAACYALAVTIFAASLGRDYLVQRAIEQQPTHPMLMDDAVRAAGGVIGAAGMVLVLATYYRLGITGTYLGDYFGILLDARVTGFPFSVVDNPMYLGSTLNFVALALTQGSPAGLVIAALVFVVYQAAIAFEGPFTAMIYAQRDEARRRAGKQQ